MASNGAKHHNAQYKVPHTVTAPGRRHATLYPPLSSPVPISPCLPCLVDVLMLSCLLLFSFALLPPLALLSLLKRRFALLLHLDDHVAPPRLLDVCRGEANKLWGACVGECGGECGEGVWRM